MIKKSFKNQSIWIIGASHGIGRALALELSKRDAKMIISARDKQALLELKKEMKGSDHIVLPLDISDEKKVKKAVNSLKKKGRLDRIICMAGIYEPTACKDMTINNISNTIDINLKSVFYLVHHILPIFEEQKEGQLVLCASVSGYFGMPNGQPYSASKAGIINFAESLKNEYYKSDIDIKVINPGFVKTRLTAKNKFKMPMLIETKEAALHIIKGLNKRSFEIYFPKRFIMFFKILRLLPYSLYFAIMGRLDR